MYFLDHFESEVKPGAMSEKFGSPYWIAVAFLFPFGIATADRSKEQALRPLISIIVTNYTFRNSRAQKKSRLIIQGN